MPWYNLGKLSANEESMVNEALIEDPSLKDQLALDKDIMTKVIADPKLLDRSAFESSTVRLDKVLAQLDEGTTKVTKKQAKPAKEKKPSVDLFAGVKSLFSGLLSGSSHSFTYAVFAALTVVQLGLLMFFVVPSTMQEQRADNFGPASGEPVVHAEGPSVDKNGSGLVLIISMKDNIKIEGFTSNTLGKLKFDLLPSDAGYYRVRLNKELSSKEIEVLKNELSHETAEVIFVGEEF